MFFAFVLVCSFVVEDFVHVWEAGVVSHQTRHPLDPIEAFEIFIHGVAAVMVLIASVHFFSSFFFWVLALYLQLSLFFRSMWLRYEVFILQKMFLLFFFFLFIMNLMLFLLSLFCYFSFLFFSFPLFFLEYFISRVMGDDARSYDSGKKLFCLHLSVIVLNEFISV